MTSDIEFQQHEAARRIAIPLPWEVFNDTEYEGMGLHFGGFVFKEFLRPRFGGGGLH